MPLDRDNAKTVTADARTAKVVAETDKTLVFIAFPSTDFSSPHHYAMFIRGDTPLTSRLVKPVLMDAGRGELTASVEVPWYLTALLVSQPLHFGDYGGMPMQILWALLDIITIVVLGSGLYLLVKRREPHSLIEEAEAVVDLQERPVEPHAQPARKSLS